MQVLCLANVSTQPAILSTARLQHAIHTSCVPPVAVVAAQHTQHYSNPTCTHTHPHSCMCPRAKLPPTIAPPHPTPPCSLPAMPLITPHITTSSIPNPHSPGPGPHPLARRIQDRRGVAPQRPAAHRDVARAGGGIQVKGKWGRADEGAEQTAPCSFLGRPTDGRPACASQHILISATLFCHPPMHARSTESHPPTSAQTSAFALPACRTFCMGPCLGWLHPSHAASCSRHAHGRTRAQARGVPGHRGEQLRGPPPGAAAGDSRGSAHGQPV